MNYPGTSGFPPGGGGFLNAKPIWHPPVSMTWIVSLAMLVGAANVEELPRQFKDLVLHPVGFFVGLLVSLALYERGYTPIAFASLFLLLIIWAVEHNREGFSGTMDWVTNDKRWFSEVVMKEQPIAIQDKNVRTYPVQGY